MGDNLPPYIMDNDFQAKAEKKMSALESWLAPLFAKAPHIPENARQTLVQIAPWLALIFGILGLFAVFSAGAIGTLLSFSFVGAGTIQLMLLLSMVVAFLSAILNLLAFKPLQAHKKKGWNYLFYGSVLSAIATVVNIVFGYGSVFGLIFTLIGFWLLFEVRSYYH